jgi:hypothetical protein
MSIHHSLESAATGMRQVINPWLQRFRLANPEADQPAVDMACVLATTAHEVGIGNTHDLGRTLEELAHDLLAIITAESAHPDGNPIAVTAMTDCYGDLRYAAGLWDAGN